MYYGLKMFQNHFLEGTEKEEPEIVKKEHGDSDEYVPCSYFISQFFPSLFCITLWVGTLTGYWRPKVTGR